MSDFARLLDVLRAVDPNEANELVIRTCMRTLLSVFMILPVSRVLCL
jgi:hypothetical protein